LKFFIVLFDFFKKNIKYINDRITCRIGDPLDCSREFKKLHEMSDDIINGLILSESSREFEKNYMTLLLTICKSLTV